MGLFALIESFFNHVSKKVDENVNRICDLEDKFYKKSDDELKRIIKNGSQTEKAIAAKVLRSR